MKPPVLLFLPRRGDAWLGHASSRPRRGVALLCASACLGLALLAGWRAWQVQDDLAAAQQSLQRAGLARPARPVAALSGLGALPSAQRLRSLNSVVDRLNLPWPAVLNLLELETRAPVTLLALSADAERASLRIEAEAPAMADLLAYAQRLRQHPLIGQVLLVRHDANEREILRPIRLTLDLLLAAPYRPATVAGDSAATTDTERR